MSAADNKAGVLNIDDVDNRPSLEMVLSTAAFYGLGDGPARQLVEEVAAAVDGWQDAARRAGVASYTLPQSGDHFGTD